jgi:hypothetical protein
LRIFEHFEESRAKRNKVRRQLQDSDSWIGNGDPGFISDREESRVKTWAHFKHDGERPFKIKSDIEPEIALQLGQKTKKLWGLGGDFRVTKVKPLNRDTD